MAFRQVTLLVVPTSSMCVSHLTTPLIFVNFMGKHGISLLVLLLCEVNSPTPRSVDTWFFELAHGEKQQAEINRGETRYTGIIGFRVQNPAWGEVEEARVWEGIWLWGW